MALGVAVFVVVVVVAVVVAVGSRTPVEKEQPPNRKNRKTTNTPERTPTEEVAFDTLADFFDELSTD